MNFLKNIFSKNKTQKPTSIIEKFKVVGHDKNGKNLCIEILFTEAKDGASAMKLARLRGKKRGFKTNHYFVDFEKGKLKKDKYFKPKTNTDLGKILQAMRDNEIPFCHWDGECFHLDRNIDFKSLEIKGKIIK